MKEIIPVLNTNIINSETLTPEIYTKFIEYIDAKPKTIQTYTRAIRQFKNYLARENINTPKRSDILSFRENLISTGHKPTTIQNYITIIKLFFQWTAQENIYPNIAEHIKGASISKTYKKDYLTSNQVKAVLQNIDRSTIKGKRDYAILVIMITGGLRTIEVSRANIEDLRTAGNNTVLFIQGKGKDEKQDYVKIPTETETAIREYLKTRTKIFPEQALFTSTSNNNFGQALSTRGISGIVKQRFRNAGYDSPRLTAHSLRHTAVTLSLIGGRNPQEVQQFARHSSIATTMIYAHNLERENNKCEATIANAIFQEVL